MPAPSLESHGCGRRLRANWSSPTLSSKHETHDDELPERADAGDDHGVLQQRHEQHAEEGAEDACRRRPARLAPPSTTAVMTLSSTPWPASTTAVLSREASSAPARPDRKPMIRKKLNTVRSTLMPESFAARALPPI